MGQARRPSVPAPRYSLSVARAVSAKLASGIPTVDEVAVDLGVAARTLRRRLEEEGTTFRDLVERVQRERADALLARGESVRDVAFLLGFSGGTAFSRAYRRWTGKAPSDA